jgi:hypothetical protein
MSLRDILRGQSKTDSIDALARDGDGGLLAKIKKLKEQEDTDIRGAMERGLIYDAVKKSNDKKKKNGGQEMMEPDDVLHEGSGGKMIQGEPHRLAWVNPEEEQMMKASGGAGAMQPDGHPAYYGGGGDGDDGSGWGWSDSDTGDSWGAAGGGGSDGGGSSDDGIGYDEPAAPAYVDASRDDMGGVDGSGVNYDWNWNTNNNGGYDYGADDFAEGPSGTYANGLDYDAMLGEAKSGNDALRGFFEQQAKRNGDRRQNRGSGFVDMLRGLVDPLTSFKNGPRGKDETEEEYRSRIGDPTPQSVKFDKPTQSKYDEAHRAEAERIGVHPSQIEKSGGPFDDYTIAGRNIGTSGFTSGTDFMGRSGADQFDDVTDSARGSAENEIKKMIADFSGIPKSEVAKKGDKLATTGQSLTALQNAMHEQFQGQAKYGQDGQSRTSSYGAPGNTFMENQLENLGMGPTTHAINWAAQALGTMVGGPGQEVIGTTEDDQGRGMHVHADGQVTYISPEDEPGYTGGDYGNEGSEQPQQAPQQQVAGAPTYANVEQPAGLDLTGSDLQKLSQLATFASYGGAGQGPARSDEGQAYFKQLARGVYGEGGEGEDEVLPIALQYLTDVLGGASSGTGRDDFLKAIA